MSSHNFRDLFRSTNSTLDWALLATAITQLRAPLIIVIAGLNLVPIAMSELIVFTLIVKGPFAALYVGSALLFRKAAREHCRNCGPG